MKRVIAALLLMVVPVLTANGGVPAGDNSSIPEPETLALLAVAAVAVVITRWRHRK